MALSKHGKTFLKDWESVINKVYALSHTYNKGSDLLDNYNWRTVIAAYIVEQDLPGLKVSKSRHGVDATVSGKKMKIEIKTSKGTPGQRITPESVKGEFDKQERSDMAEKVSGIENLIISKFCDGETLPAVTVFIPKHAMAPITRLFSAKQARFALTWKGNGRDSIVISLEDIAAEASDSEKEQIKCYTRDRPIPFFDLYEKLSENGPLSVRCAPKV